MGEYMADWGRMENVLKLCIQELLGIDEVLVQAVTSSMMTRQTIELLESLAEASLTPHGAKKVKDLCNKLTTRNRFRNNIVHGYWVCHVTNPQTGEAIWLRKYDPVSYALAKLPNDHEKITGTYCFTLPQLADTTSRLEPVIGALADLQAEMPSLRL